MTETTMEGRGPQISKKLHDVICGQPLIPGGDIEVISSVRNVKVKRQIASNDALLDIAIFKLRSSVEPSDQTSVKR